MVKHFNGRILSGKKQYMQHHLKKELATIEDFMEKIVIIKKFYTYT